MAGRLPAESGGIEMKRKRQGKCVTAWLLIMSLCFTSFWVSEATVRSADTGFRENEVTLQNPVIEPEKGKISWDCVYFGNYWQSEYIPETGSRPEQGEDDVVHEDADGTKYLVREDKSCYKYEPIKWRVLSVSEDGSDAFIMSDKNLDVQSYHAVYSGNITWENADVRAWLNEDFLNGAFTDEEKEGIIPTEIENRKSPEYVKEEGEEEEAPTTDQIYLLSRGEITSRAYGFTDDISGTETRKVENTDFARAGGTIKADDVSADYWLRTMRTNDRVSHVDYLEGTIPVENVNALLNTVNGTSRIRPVLHLDLTKTDIWHYAGKVRQDGIETAPDASATPAAPTQEPETMPGVTMAPGQAYPKNPVVDETDGRQNIWDCIYFGGYYQKKITPAVLAEAGEHDTVKADGGKGACLVRHEQGYFRYEPLKWRVLSVNEDGTDAFLMADQVVDVASYDRNSEGDVTWEKSAIREWLNRGFIEMAFPPEEQAAVETTEVTTADNPWSKEPGGNDTKDKVYLPSIEEMLHPAFGFSSDAAEGDTRKITATDYAVQGGTPNKPPAGFIPYWLRSPGVSKGCPAQVGHWGEGEILTEPSVMIERAAAGLGVRPVIHVDLSDKALWTYAGQVTPKGVVVPEKEQPTPAPDVTDEPTPNPDVTDETTPAPDVTGQPAAPAPNHTEQPSVTLPTPDPQPDGPEGKKPGKPTIKKLKNQKGKKVTITLSGKVSGAAGYQVAYAVKSSMKGQKSKFFKGTSVTVKGLKKKKTYYFRVRAYSRKDGKNVYGSWGKKKRIKIKN